MTVFDQASNDLKNSRLVMYKLGETFTDFKIRSFSVISLCEQWQTLQGTFAKVHNSLEERVIQLEAKEREIGTARNNLRNLQTEVELRQKKLDLEEKSLSERTEFVGLREKEVKDWRESLELEKRLIGEQYKAMKVAEKRTSDLRAKVISKREEELDAKEKELGLKEVRLEKNKNDMDLVLFALERKEKDNNEKSVMLGLKEKEIDERSELLEAKEKRMLEDAKAMELELKHKIDEFNRQVELKEKEIEERSLALQTKEEQFDNYSHKNKNEVVVVRDDDDDDDDDQMDDYNNDLKSNVNELDEQLVCDDGHPVLSNCQTEEHDQRNSSGSSNLTNVRQELLDSEIHQVAYSKDSSSTIFGYSIRSLCMKMDALFLGFNISNNVKAKTISPEEILDGLRHAPDPGKLVIRVTRTFHQNFSDKDMTTIYKDSCILILEQLMKLSPPITHDVKEEARGLAITLKTVKGRTPADNFGFLQFVAAFKLANCFDPNDLISMFVSLYGGVKMYRHEKLACLCSALGLSDKLPGLVKSHIKRNRLITAVKCICVFRLEHMFLPVPLLECYLDQLTQKVNDKLKQGPFNSKVQIEADNMEISFLQDVINCITTFKLESKFPPDPLISRIQTVKKLRQVALDKLKNKRSASSYDSVANPKQLKKRRKVGNNHCTK